MMTEQLPAFPKEVKDAEECSNRLSSAEAATDTASKFAVSVFVEI
jgi:hypothetical protein